MEQVLETAKQYLSEYRFQIIIAAIFLLVTTLSVVIIRYIKEASRPLKIGICGMPNAGKTKLYMYLMTGELVNTVKSAQINTFTGYFDVYPKREATLVDIPSDKAISGAYDYASLDVVLFMTPEVTRDSILQLANLIVKLSPKCKVFANFTDKHYI